MYVKITKNSVGQAYYHLVESYRAEGKTKQRTLLSLGKVGDGKLEALAAALAKHTETLSILDIAKSIDIKDSFIYGPMVVLERLFERHGVDQILIEQQSHHEQLGFSLRDVVFTLVASRFVRPSSKLKIYEHYQHKLYGIAAAEEELKLHQLYRALDVLALHKDDIERGLFHHGRDLFNQRVDVVLYDLTTLRFESVKNIEGSLRRFGYSKEMRSDCTQVILGLLVDPEGIPLGFEVYPGNTFEGKTLPDIVAKLRNKFKVRRFILVGDRGLFSKKNLQAMVDCQTGGDENTSHEIDLPHNQDLSDFVPGEFIVGMKLGVLKSRGDEFYDRSRYRWLKEDELAVYETTYQDKRCIITWSKARKERDEKARKDILKKLEKKLQKPNAKAKDFVTHSIYRRYVKGLNDGQTLTLDENEIAKDQEKDGFFGVLTNIKDLSAQEIVGQYKNLWIIEDAFGEIKGTLKARPVFHWTDQRIVGHLTMCFIAYLCEAHLTKALRQKVAALKSPAIDDGVIDERALTAVEGMRELCEVRAMPVSIRDKTIWVRTDFGKNAVKLLQALHIKIPPKVLNLTNLVAEPTSPRPDVLQ